MVFNAYRTISSIICKKILIEKKKSDEAFTINHYAQVAEYQPYAKETINVAKEAYLKKSKESYESLISSCNKTINSCLHFMVIKLNDIDEELSNYYCLCCRKEICLNKNEIEDNRIIDISENDIEFVKENIELISEYIYGTIREKPQMNISETNELVKNFINELKPLTLNLKKGE